MPNIDTYIRAYVCIYVSKSYLLRSTKPYEDVYVSIDKITAE